MEYLQANLLVSSQWNVFHLSLSQSKSYLHFSSPLVGSRTKAFTLPEAYRDPDSSSSATNDTPSYDLVFDFTGETDLNADEEVHIERTGRLLPELGRLAAQCNVKAYVRELPPLYRSDNKKPLKEGDGKPFSMRSKWQHEGVRAMAALPESVSLLLKSSLDDIIVGFCFAHGHSI